MKKLDCIWLIDDDEIAIYIADKVIQKVEFSKDVEKFNSAKSALKHLEFCINIKDNLPDLILFDLNMPHMSGWDFIDEFCKIEGSQSIPTFIFTSSITQKEIEKSKLYACIKGIILKPLCVQKLNKILRLLDVECLAPTEKVFIPHIHSSYYLNTGTGI
jgi:CheY-like chemotaxis protein